MSAQLKPKPRRTKAVGPYQPIPNRTLTKDQFLDEVVTRHGFFRDNWAFVCPNCGGIQTIADFKNLDVDANTVTFACIGRYDASRGCDHIITGDAPNHTLEVIDGDSLIPSFDIA
jgi:hypothetical protein